MRNDKNFISFCSKNICLFLKKERERLLGYSVCPAKKSFCLDEEFVGGPLSHIRLAAQNSITLNPASSIYSPTADCLMYDKINTSQTNAGIELETKLCDINQTYEIILKYELLDKTPVVKCRTVLKNISESKLVVEDLSSAVFYNLGAFNDSKKNEEILIYIPYSNWCAEGQWQAFKPHQIGLCENFEPVKQSPACFSVSNVGSFSCGTHLPMAIIENRSRGLAYFWQIEYSGSWRWELGEYLRTLYVCLAGANAKTGNWLEVLQPQQAVNSIPVAFGVVEGTFEHAVKALTDYRRHYLKVDHREDANLPVFVNDYMHGLKANPIERDELQYISAAAKTGAEYYVIDAGWYSSVGEDWWSSVGQWKESPDRFPNLGLVGLCDKIRELKMKPGLWIEIEAVGVNSVLAKKPDDWFFQRHGQRVSDNGRYFLDFRNPNVREHAHRIINSLIESYGIEYLKIDYNINSGIGTDLKAASPASGQMRHIFCYYGWLNEIHEAHPSLVIENCSSGGMRMDYGMLSHTQVQSLSDQENFKMFPSIVNGCLANVLPEQAMAWAYPMANDSVEVTVFNLVTVMTSRFLLSGQIHKLTDKQMSFVKEAVAKYKEIRCIINESYPFWPSGTCKTGQQDRWVTLGLRNKDFTEMLIYVWRLNDEADKLKLDIRQWVNGRADSKVVFPSLYEDKVNYNPNAGLLEINLPSKYSACVIKVRKN